MPKVGKKKFPYSKKGKAAAAKKGKSAAAAKARKDHKKVDSRFKDGVRKNGKMKIKSGPNSPKRKTKKKK